MRYAVLSDIHGNAHALQAVLGRAARVGVDRFIVAGDLVGYGPAPNACVEMVAGLDAVCVVGNHDLMAIDRLPDDRCIALARENIRWTRAVLRADARDFIAGLPGRARAPGGVVIAHGSLDDPETGVCTATRAARELARLRAQDPAARVLVLGHTHRAFGYSARRGSTGTRAAVSLDPSDVFLLNPGAVGQSRDRHPYARLLVLDLSARTGQFIAVDYDVEGCRSALQRAGLAPDSCHLRPSRRRVAARAVRATVASRRAAWERLTV